jgi:hypothetical protein
MPVTRDRTSGCNSTVYKVEVMSGGLSGGLKRLNMRVWEPHEMKGGGST